MGLDLVLEASGLVPVAANEFDPVICETIRKNCPRLRLYGQDIRLLTNEPPRPTDTCKRRKSPSSIGVYCALDLPALQNR